MEEQLNSVTPLMSSILWGETVSSTYHLILILIYNCGGLYVRPKRNGSKQQLELVCDVSPSASAAVTFSLWALVRSAGCAHLATRKILQ